MYIQNFFYNQYYYYLDYIRMYEWMEWNEMKIIITKRMVLVWSFSGLFFFYFKCKHSGIHTERARIYGIRTSTFLFCNNK